MNNHHNHYPLRYQPECDGWKTVTVIRIADGDNRGMDRINIVMSCPICGGDVLVSAIVPQITGKILYINFSSRGHCRECGKYVRLKLPRKPTKRWKELAEEEILQCLWEDAHKYIPEIHSQSRSKKKRLSKGDVEERRQKRYARILKDISDSGDRKIA